LGQSKNLREKVKADDAQQHTSREAKNKMQPVAEPKRKQAAAKR
jgi:hypothetical protein